MAFLEVNGYTIPVASCSAKDQEIGGRVRSFDGTPISEIRQKKRILECTTPPVKELVREAIRGIIAGDGWVFPYGVKSAGGSPDLYSGKGVTPVSGSQATVNSAYGADGAIILQHNYNVTVNPSEHTATRSGTLDVNRSTSNFLTADSRDAENAPTGYNAVGAASLGSSTTHYWQGTKSLSVTTSGSNQGAETAAASPGAGSAGKTYVASFYAKRTSGDQTWKVRLRDYTNTALGTEIQFSGSLDSWVRVSATITIGGSDCLDLRVQVRSTNTSEIYLDGFQIEEGDWPTAWVDGDRSSDDSLSYELQDEAEWHDFSIGTWFWGPAAAQFPSHGNDAYVWSFYDDGGTVEASLLRESGGTTFTFRTVGIDGVQRDLSDTLNVAFDAWNFIGVAYRHNPQNGEVRKTMRIIHGDGILGGSAASTTVTDNTDHDVLIVNADQGLHVGEKAGSENWIGHLGELTVYPFAVPVDVWDAIAINLGDYGESQNGDPVPQPQWPRKLVTGDVSPSYQTLSELKGITETRRPTYEGRVIGMSSLVGNVDGAKTDLRTVSFTLEQT